MKGDREIDRLPSRVVGRRREGTTAQVRLRPSSRVDDASGVPEVRPPTIDGICRALDDAGARYVLIRPSDAADRAWLESLRGGDSE